ncbi:unannotated protein [freshwater metagenome]|uniref:Unannotated protein n=1 Tax=freshwater metagenome TaxID=449393 RepID=A0A6J6MKH7_9ZZZZ|nr:hypothetical protein [Actinomycetota bacterium]MSX81875.1 hypothetical protein [Actinomycetota bacterium]MSZ30471.1 hypothetical protein [Actinomycetota bacterium]
MNIPERERPQSSEVNTPSDIGSPAQSQVGTPYSRVLKPSYLKRWRRSWRPRVWAAGAGALGIIAGAGVIAISQPAQSNAASGSVPTPIYPTVTTTPTRVWLEDRDDDDRDDDRWQDDLFNDGSSNPTTTTQQWVNTAPVPAPRSTPNLPAVRAPQVTTRSS